MDPSPAAAPSVGLGLAAVVVLVALNAFFVAAEFALVGARKTRLDEQARTGDGKARLARRAVQSLDRYISATQLGITLASLGLGWIGEPALAHLVDDGFALLPGDWAPVLTHAVASSIAFVVITAMHIVLGELVPKALALLYPEAVSGWVAAPLMGFGWVMAAPIAVLNNTANALLRFVGIRTGGDHERLHSPEEIRMLVEQSGEAGQLEQADARLLEGVFEFSDKSAEEVMTPRTQVVALHADLTVERAADAIAQAGRSRYPVHTGSLDEIVGVVHAKDVLRALRQAPGAALRTLMRAPLFVPGTREVEDVLTDMKRLKVHLAVVLDEYGGTAGLVTMEDLLEEIVGDIYDEHDRPPAAPAPDAAAPIAPSGEALLDGALPISEFNAQHDAELDDAAYTTIGGLVFGQLGRLPQVGDRVTLGTHTFEVAEMAGRRVARVRMVA
ncbi:MAG: hemolysin family protein [Gemmatimonadales bacterium]|nr:hemolysin family protein [Gemmatimonadales bacterium]